MGCIQRRRAANLNKPYQYRSGDRIQPERGLPGDRRYDGRAIIWCIPAGKQIFSLSGRAVQIYRVAFSPDGQQLASANSDGTTQLWDVSPGEEFLTFTGHSGIVNQRPLQPGWQAIFTASGDGTAALWDARTGQPVWLRGHASSVIRAVFNTDGSRVATASDDLTARIWDASTGKELVRLSGHTIGTNSSPFSGVLDAAFSPDNTRLATAGSDTTIRIWDAGSGEGVDAAQGSQRTGQFHRLQSRRCAAGLGQRRYHGKTLGYRLRKRTS